MLRSVRWRGIDLVGLAAALLVPVLLLTAAALGLPPWGQAAPPPAAQPRSEWNVDLHGASGTLPQTDELSAGALAVLAAPGRLDQGPAIPGGELPIPAPAADAYRRVEQVLGRVNPACGLSWPLLAGLGRVISNHGGGAFDAQGTTTQLILGPQLDGGLGLAEITDTDEGRLDTDTEWDRAAGPMQIVPAAWRSVGADSDADGKANPHNIYDSALAAGRFLCQHEVDLRDLQEQARAVFRYQRSESFVRATIAWSRAYGGAPETPEAGSPLAVRTIPIPETLSAVRPARRPRSDQLLADPDRAPVPRSPAPEPTGPPTTSSPTQPPAEPAAEPTQAPAEPTQAPTESTQAPTESPAEPTQAPTESPPEPTQAPTDPTQAPTDQAQAPTDQAQAPTDPTQAPTDPTQAPADPTASPTEPLTQRSA